MAENYVIYTLISVSLIGIVLTILLYLSNKKIKHSR